MQAGGNRKGGAAVLHADLDGGTPATPAVPDPPVPNRAHTETKIGDPPPPKGAGKSAPSKKQA